MIVYRPFRNDDPPRLADVRRTADLGPGAFQPMSAALRIAAVWLLAARAGKGLIMAAPAPSMAAPRISSRRFGRSTLWKSIARPLRYMFGGECWVKGGR